TGVRFQVRIVSRALLCIAEDLVSFRDAEKIAGSPVAALSGWKAILQRQAYRLADSHESLGPQLGTSPPRHD
ncbi:MAG TPA: hypothetical protein VIX37_19185, partial [Candidatus Sulfotelmatobacter sp.]